MVINVGFSYNAPRPMPTSDKLHARASMSVLSTHLMGCLLFYLVNWRRLLFYGSFIILYVCVYLSLSLTTVVVQEGPFITVFTGLCVNASLYLCKLHNYRPQSQNCMCWEY